MRLCRLSVFDQSRLGLQLSIEKADPVIFFLVSVRSRSCAERYTRHSVPRVFPLLTQGID